MGDKNRKLMLSAYEWGRRQYPPAHAVICYRKFYEAKPERSAYFASPTMATYYIQQFLFSGDGAEQRHWGGYVGRPALRMPTKTIPFTEELDDDAR